MLVLIAVVLVGTLLFSESLRKRIADAANGLRWVQSLRADPRGTLAETVNPSVKPGLSSEEQAWLDRIEARLDGRESGAPPHSERRERRDRAVRDIVTDPDPDPDARAAADELASEQGIIDKDLEITEHRLAALRTQAVAE